jgi:hypothetical protein
LRSFHTTPSAGFGARFIPDRYSCLDHHTYPLQADARVMSVQPAPDLIQDAARASALLPREHLAILGVLREPGSATGVARRLGLPRLRVGYTCAYARTPGSSSRWPSVARARSSRGSCANLAALAARTLRDLARLRAAARARASGSARSSRPP